MHLSVDTSLGLSESEPEPDETEWKPAQFNSTLASSITEDISSRRSSKTLKGILALAEQAAEASHSAAMSLESGLHDTLNEMNSFSGIAQTTSEHCSRETKRISADVQQRALALKADDLSDSAESRISVSGIDTGHNDLDPRQWPCIWLEPSILDPLKKLRVSGAQVPGGVHKEVLTQHVWDLCREHEELLRMADEQ
ncbi:unnamed protein product, partial [Durusdinium trenchii]